MAITRGQQLTVVGVIAIFMVLSVVVGAQGLRHSLQLRRKILIVGWYLTTQTATRSVSSTTLSSCLVHAQQETFKSSASKRIRNYHHEEGRSDKTISEMLRSFAEQTRQDQISSFSDRRQSSREPLASANESLRALAADFAKGYPQLPPIMSTKDCQRLQTLRFLALECSVASSQVASAINHYNRVQASKDPDLSISHALERLRQATRPLYDEIFRCLLECCASDTLRFAVACRADILKLIAWLQDRHNNENKQLLSQIKPLDVELRKLLTTWFSPSLLELQRISYDTTPALVIERMVRNEAVHPVQDLKDLQLRLGPTRRVFCLGHPLLPLQPLVVVHVSLQRDAIPSSMQQVHQAPLVHQPTVAAFYSISNLESGLSGLGLGEYLLRQTITALRKELPSLQTFATLSPMPEFRAWLQEHASSSSSEMLIKDDALLERLASSMQCEKSTALSVLLQRLELEGPQLLLMHQDNNHTVIADSLRHLAATYIVQEKHRGKPLDRVARFHLANGASVYRINVGADLSSHKGWRNSLGVMMNYRYDKVEVLEERKLQFHRTGEFPVHDSVRKLLMKPKEENGNQKSQNVSRE